MKEFLEEFLSRASDAAGEYDCGFIEATYGEDEHGLFAQTALYSEDDLAEATGDEEMPKLRVVSIVAGHHSFERVVVVEWMEERSPSICVTPHDLMAVFYT